MEPVPADFRKHFRKHNWEVLSVTMVSAGGAVMVWSGLYGLSYLVTLVLVTFGSGINATPPARFPVYFAGASVALCLFRVALRGRIFPERLRADGRYFLWIVTELLFFPPNLILAVPGNLAALVWLRKEELQAAWVLLRGLDKKKRCSLATAPFLVADERLRARALWAMQISGLIRIDPAEHDWLIALKTDAAASLASGRVRFNTGRRAKKTRG